MTKFEIKAGKVFIDGIETTNPELIGYSILDIAEDKDFVIRALLKGCMTAEFRWLAYCCPSMGEDLLNTSVKDRMSQQHDEMKANFGDVEFVKWIKDRNDYKNVRINWNAATKHYNALTGSNITKANNKYNLAEILEL